MYRKEKNKSNGNNRSYREVNRLVLVTSLTPPRNQFHARKHIIIVATKMKLRNG